MSHACPWWPPPSPSEWVPPPARPTPGPSCAPGGDVGSCGSHPAGPFLACRMSWKQEGARRLPAWGGAPPSRLGRRGSRVTLEGLYEQAGPGLQSCSGSTDGGKASLPLPLNLLCLHPSKRPPRSSRLFQNSPGLYLCPSSARIEKAVRKEFRQKETCWRDTSFFPRKYNLFLTACSYVGLTL